ncbi:MAG: glycosyltransferase family 39 protein [Bryobacteraceae bacterium]|nr:glycosyltransferase family 39 protein [Bryobacteraceae bacterium]MDW8377921.1 glycosyltransferase family 39 protein [Bryobacterales bacterium]
MPKLAKLSRAVSSSRREHQAGKLSLWELGALISFLGVLSGFALFWHTANGHTLYFGDAAAHLAIARRIVDSRTPGVFQIGSVWLPLPHVLMLPLVGRDSWWRSGLAGALPTALAFLLGGVFLYLAVRRLYGCRRTAGLAAALYALNPNLLYLQAIPMTEPLFLGALMGLFWALVTYASRPSLGAVAGAALALNAASLTRYEGWFVTPFAALLFWLAGRPRRLGYGLLLAGLGALGPLWWLFHNWWFFGDVWYFFDGPYSAKAIYQRQLQAGMSPYPGDHNWKQAVIQFQAAVQLCSGKTLFWLGLAGLLAAVFQRAWLGLALLILPSIFYLVSIYSAGTPIFVPHLWPYSYYNIRYGFAAYPLLILGACSLAAVAPKRLRTASAVAVVLLAVAPWLAYPRKESWMVWKESQVNSEARRAWTAEAASYLQQHYRPGAGIFSTLGDLASIYREAGIALKEVLHEGNRPHWDAVLARPDLFLWEEWAVAVSGDPVATAVLRARRRGPRYECVKIISIKEAPVIEIYRRMGPIDRIISANANHEDSVRQGARRPQ